MMFIHPMPAQFHALLLWSQTWEFSHLSAVSMCTPAALQVIELPKQLLSAAQAQTPTAVLKPSDAVLVG